MNKSPLVLPAIFWSLGLIVGKIFHISFLISSILFLFIFFFLIIKNIRTQTILILIFVLAILRWDIHIFLPKNHIYNLLKKRSQFTQPIKGKIISEVKKQNKSFKFILELQRLKKHPIKGKIIFYTYQQGLEYGDIIECTTLIKKIENSSNPADFDYKEYLFSKGIHAKGFSKSYIKLIDYKPDIFRKYIILSKKFLRKRIKLRFYKYANFTKAIIIAEKDNLKDWKTNLTKSGLSHLLAVSGLHIAIITLIIFTLLKIFVLNRYLLYFSIAFILICYGFITGWPPSVMRAITMIILYFLSKILQRKSNANNILAATLIITTIIDPNQLFSAGFQMSFFAVFTLFNLNFNLNLSKYGKFTGVLEKILTVMIYSFFLNLSLSPITMYHFHTLNMNGVFSNIIGIPILGIILPLAIVVIFLPYPLYVPFQYSYYFVMTIFEKFVELTSKLPFNYTFIKLSGLRFFILLSLIFFFFSYKKYIRKPLLKFAFFFMLIAIVILPYKNENLLKIIFFDGDKGELILLKTPDKKNILINCGLGNYSSKRFERTVLPYLKKNGISTLDKLIITSFHNEYYGGLSEILSKIKINRLIIPADLQNTLFFKKIKTENKIDDSQLIILKDKQLFDNDDTHFNIFKHKSNDDFSIKISHKKTTLLLYPEFSKNYITIPNCDIIKIDNISYKKLNLKTLISQNPQKIIFISTHGKRNRTYLKNYLEKFKTNKLFFSSTDGALIIETNGYKIKYHSLITDKKGEIDKK